MNAYRNTQEREKEIHPHYDRLIVVRASFNTDRFIYFLGTLRGRIYKSVGRSASAFRADSELYIATYPEMFNT